MNTLPFCNFELDPNTEKFIGELLTDNSTLANGLLMLFHDISTQYEHNHLDDGTYVTYSQDNFPQIKVIYDIKTIGEGAASIDIIRKRVVGEILTDMLKYQIDRIHQYLSLNDNNRYKYKYRYGVRKLILHVKYNDFGESGMLPVISVQIEASITAENI